MRILIVEDEAKIAQALKSGLESELFSATVASHGNYDLVKASKDFDLMLLDLMLPGRSGFEVLRSLREAQVLIPVLVLTARDGIEDRVRGLNSGADDYLIKPFAFPELVARIRALLRRTPASIPSRLKIHDLEIDLFSRQVLRHGQSIDLTAREFDILKYLAAHSGQHVSREMLARDVWKQTTRNASLDNVIDVHMTRLRRKIDPPATRIKLIQTIRGIGFMLKGTE